MKTRKEASADVNQPERLADYKEESAACNRTDLVSVRAFADTKTHKLINHRNKIHEEEKVK